ncbi:class I SAM-dependent methyltransferase [Laspinema olomoucense]|uniref:class I SAM-dependent methyltransferase n=1 Tax=Laspinema olomoucense TaxID=3231600 RepID=UPI0021BBAA6E|nr:class I SAM-dependent methyltransferase [Laspinema sp. D3d]MCT7972908.1 class I SAM-dependent methyltransferase [Laspinema sp. D3d]
MQVQPMVTEYFAKQDYEGAIAISRQNIQAQPQVIVNYWYLGIALLLQGKQTEAEQCWNAVLSQGTPPQVQQWAQQIYELLGAIATQQESVRDWQSALVLRDRISAIAPNDINNHLARLQLYLHLGILDSTLSERLITTAELLASSNSSNLNQPLLIEVLRQLALTPIFHVKSLNLLEAALTQNLLNHPHWNQNITLQETYGNYYRNKAQKHCDYGEFQDAIFCFYKAQELVPEISITYPLGMAFLAQGQLREAAELLSQIPPHHPEYGSARYILSAIYTPQSEEVIRTIYQRVIEKSWANCKYAQAANAAKKMVELEPSSSHAHYNLGMSLYYQGLFTSNVEKVYQAEIALKKALEFKPNNEILLKKLSTIPYTLKFAQKGYNISADCFTGVMPIWEQNFRKYANTPNLRVIEVGCFEGMASCWLLDNILTHETARITCIDNFEGVVDSKKNDPTVQKSVEERFDGNIEKSGAKHKVDKRVGFSQEVLRSLPLNFYHIVYIDGSHFAIDVLQDAVLSWGLIKEGGMIIFDDYHFEFPDRPHCNTGRGIDAFMTVFQEKLKVIYRDDRQIFLEKLSH